jgi:protein-tyrosine phosphatase
MIQEPSTILFLCTGNYYRSRFAEMLFNAHAAKLGLPWLADSRGLALERGVGNHGPAARCVIELLTQRGHPIPNPLRFPIQLHTADLPRFTRVIALKEAEHRPLLAERYPGWEDRVEYWHIHDIDFATVEETLSGIERETRRLIDDLQRFATSSR